MWWWWCQDVDRSKTPLLETRERPGRGHQCPPGPTTPVVLRYFLLNTGWPAELLDGGKRFVAVDGCYLDCSTTCIEHLRSWRWRYLPSHSWPVGVEDCDPQLESRVSNDQSISIDHASFTGLFWVRSQLRRGAEPYIPLWSLASLCPHALQQRCVWSTSYVGRRTLSGNCLRERTEPFLIAGRRTRLTVTHPLLLWTPLQ